MQVADIGHGLRELYGSPLHCLDPFPIYRPGENYRDASGKVVRRMVPCGRCRFCTATRKDNWTGRLMAEASTSASVTFVTLTYADAPEDFRYSDVQTMLKRFRIHLAREHGTKVRFFCCGEHGEKKGRVHWHLLFFFDKPHAIPVTKPGELWEFWDHGWTNVQNLAPETMLKKVRYTAKYAVKDYLNPRSIMRCSRRPGIGSAYLMRHALATAKAGLVPDGTFKVPGCVVGPSEAKRRKVPVGALHPFRLAGNIARKFCAVWHQAYFERRPDAPYPVSWFLRNFDENFVDVRAEVRAMQEHSVGALLDPQDFLALWVGRRVCLLTVDRRGLAVLDDDGTFYSVGASIADVLTMEPSEAAPVDDWLRRKRAAHAEVYRRKYGQETKQERAERLAKAHSLAGGPKSWSVEPDGTIIDADGVVLVAAPSDGEVFDLDDGDTISPGGHAAERVSA